MIEVILPRTFMNRVSYQLTIRAFEGEWIVTYEAGELDRFADITAHGSTLDIAVKEMATYLTTHPAFAGLRDHLLRKGMAEARRLGCENI